MRRYALIAVGTANAALAVGFALHGHWGWFTLSGLATVGTAGLLALEDLGKLR